MPDCSMTENTDDNESSMNNVIDSMRQVLTPTSRASEAMESEGTSDKTLASGSSPATSDPRRATARQRLRWRIDVFVLVQVLMKYLEKVDPEMHVRAKVVVQECSRRNKAGDPAYRSLGVAIQNCLRNTVGEYHWVRAEQIHRQAYQRAQGRLRGSSVRHQPVTPSRTVEHIHKPASTSASIAGSRPTVQTLERSPQLSPRLHTSDRSPGG